MTQLTRRRALAPTQSAHKSAGTDTTSTSRSATGRGGAGKTRGSTASSPEAATAGTHRVFARFDRDIVSSCISHSVAYVAVGTVSGTAAPVTEFKIRLEDGHVVPALDAGLSAPEVGVGKDDPALAEYFVPVEWIHAVPATDAYREPGFFANQNTAARFRHRPTLEKLYAHFGVAAPEADHAPVATARP